MDDFSGILPLNDFIASFTTEEKKGGLVKRAFISNASLCALCLDFRDFFEFEIMKKYKK